MVVVYTPISCLESWIKEGKYKIEEIQLGAKILTKNFFIGSSRPLALGEQTVHRSVGHSPVTHTLVRV